MPEDHQPDTSGSPDPTPRRRRLPSVADVVAAVREGQASTVPRPIVVESRPSAENREDRHFVPPMMRAATEWTWRTLVIGVGILALLKLMSIMAQVVFPVIVAVLLAALLNPIFRRLNAIMPRGLASGLTVIGTLAVISALVSFVVNQFTNQFDDMSSQVSEGIGEIRTWLRDTFGLSDGQLSQYIEQARERVGQSGELGQYAAQAGFTVGTVLTGAVIALFTLFFFLYDGPAIWSWIVRLFPRTARAKIMSSGQIAWGQLKAFTRATILVAGADAIGIGLGAMLLGVPFASGIALLVFLGAFVPVIGAFVSGFIAVILALVAQGPVTALLMFGVVVLVQQVESNVLQPLLLGRAVRVHPLAVILAIAAGVIVAGIFGALVAVPLVAVLNAVFHHLLDPDPPEVSSPEELLTPQEHAEVEQEVAESEESSEIKPGESPYRSS